MLKIAEIGTDARNIELVATVISVGERREVDTRYGPAVICNAVIDDGTAQIKWRLEGADRHG